MEELKEGEHGQYTVEGFIAWLSNLEPTTPIRAWEKGQDVEFDPLKHIDHDKVRKCIVIDLG